MNNQYLKNRKFINERKGGTFERATHIAQSLWRAWWRGQIIHPLSLKDIYETTLALGIETLPKVDHDGIYQGRIGLFPFYYIQQELQKLDIAEKEGKENE